MKYIFLATFAISTLIHLIASYKDNKELRNITKGFILFSLLSYYIIAVDNPSIFVVLAIIFSWLGDLFLIPHGVKWFVIGGIAFMISHIFFVISYSMVTDFSLVPIWPYIVFGIIYAITVWFIFRGLKPHLKKALFYPMFLYLLINGTMNCFAIFRLFSVQNLASIITVIGAILFFISDATLFNKRFNKDFKLKTHFLVMLTYSIGELLIVLGFVL